VDLRHDGPGQVRRSLAFGEQRCDQQPARARSGGGDVVGIDLHEVVPDLIRGEGDGIGFVHGQALSGVDDRAIQADARTEQYPRVVNGRTGQDCRQLHLIARRLVDHSHLLGRLVARSRDFH